ncbi:hypothetical protein [Psychrobacillus sp. FSL K6-2843]|uniref:hypothetical protein n=1 Tax=Psychrobacillus sp. FSL K6-2843 TaxID=2921549 RepID=UPI00315A035C
MGVSARRVFGATTFNNSPPLVAVIESGKSGMLRIARVDTNLSTLGVKIEIDGVIYANASFIDLFNNQSQGAARQVFGMPINYAPTNVLNVDNAARLLNIPFNDSLKITLNAGTNTNINCSYSFEYVVDIKGSV